MGEPGRTKAYHVDLRRRMVWQRLVNNCTIKEVAASLYVAEATVWRIVDRFQYTGDVSANLATPREHRLHDHDEFVLIELVCENPSIHLHEIQTQLLQITETDASAATLCHTLGSLGFTRSSSMLPYNATLLKGWSMAISFMISCSLHYCHTFNHQWHQS